MTRTAYLIVVVMAAALFQLAVVLIMKFRRGQETTWATAFRASFSANRGYGWLVFLMLLVYLQRQG